MRSNWELARILDTNPKPPFRICVANTRRTYKGHTVYKVAKV